MRRLLLTLMALAATAAASAQNNSFAIVVDSKSYDNCKEEIDSYCRSVSDDGLDAFTVVADWKSAQQVKDTLKHFFETRNLEGTVLVGDIPVAMIRGAQHMTSAFKMDEDAYDRFDSSVPSDRFYDDFDLKFDYEGQDTTGKPFFYYRLAGNSPQAINCDIYSARIKPSSERQDKYTELSKYIRKVVAAKAEMKKDQLDKVTSYSGHGSFSNSLIAWKDESVTLSEQLPATAGMNDGQKFYVFAMYPFMKDILLGEIQRKDLDLIIFHEHGVPDRQYLTGYPDPDEIDAYYESGRFMLRNIIKSKMRYGASFEEACNSVSEKYGIDSTWYADTFDPETVKADSLYDLKTGIVLDDIARAKPNVKLAIFDACYNGDFREPDCVAARYIFSDGGSLAAIGNSVNVLQDKSSSDLLGMLAAGYRVGEWMQMTNILESHIHGDPTLHFASSYNFSSPDLHNTATDYWKGFLDSSYPCDIQGLALHKLHNLGSTGMPSLLLKTYETSPYYMVRLQCMHLLAHYNGDAYPKLLAEALDDPYEFIRRKAAFYSGKTGEPAAAERLVKMYLEDYNSLRVAFNIGFTAGHFDTGVFTSTADKLIGEADFIYDKEAFRKRLDKYAASAVSMMESSRKAIAAKDDPTRKRLIYIRGMRNNPYPHLAKDMIGALEDSSQDIDFRVAVAETLGWYTGAMNRKEIHDSLQAYLGEDGIPEQLREEITKTVNRLAEYMK